MHTIQVVETKTYSVTQLHAECGVRYWEDAEVDGVQDDDGNIPCRSGDMWSVLIDLDTGVVLNWTKGVRADVHYKVCDMGRYRLLNSQGNLVKEIEGYVPSIMSPGGAGYGDYVIMSIDAEGKIENWKVSLDEFESHGVEEY